MGKKDELAALIDAGVIEDLPLPEGCEPESRRLEWLGKRIAETEAFIRDRRAWADEEWVFVTPGRYDSDVVADGGLEANKAEETTLVALRAEREFILANEARRDADYRAGEYEADFGPVPDADDSTADEDDVDA